MAAEMLLESLEVKEDMREAITCNTEFGVRS